MKRSLPGLSLALLGEGRGRKVCWAESSSAGGQQGAAGLSPALLFAQRHLLPSSEHLCYFDHVSSVLCVLPQNRFCVSLHAYTAAQTRPNLHQWKLVNQPLSIGVRSQLWLVGLVPQQVSASAYPSALE